MDEEKRLREVYEDKLICMKPGEERDKLMDQYDRDLAAYHEKYPAAKEIYDSKQHRECTFEIYFGVPRRFPTPEPSRDLPDIFTYPAELIKNE